MSIKQNVEIAALRKVYNWLDQDPANRLPKLGEYIDSYIPAGSTLGGQLEAIKSVLGDSENNWFQLIFSIFTEPQGPPAQEHRILPGFPSFVWTLFSRISCGFLGAGPMAWNL